MNRVRAGLLAGTALVAATWFTPLFNEEGARVGEKLSTEGPVYTQLRKSGRKELLLSVTVLFLTSGTSFSTPGDWNNGNNSIETIGGGAGGGTGTVGKGTNGGGGGGGGAYSKVNNLTLAGSITYAIGAGGATDTDGGDTYFNGASLGASSVGAKGGAKGVNGDSGSTGGQGGQAASGTGTTKRNGGTGGTGNSSASGGGGGGAAGPTGVGNTGNNAVSGGGGDGGSADNGGTGAGIGGTGGAGFSSDPTNGGAGTEFDGSHGCGGGGGGGSQQTPNGNKGADGGLYGGGGGGGGWNSGGGAGGGGKQGLIVVTYTPSVSGDNPPFSHRGRTPAQIFLAANQAQPDPWSPVYAGDPGGTQPYAKRQLPPQITAVQVDNPPPRGGCAAAVLATIIAIAQPSPWVYAFEGGPQPYAPQRVAALTAPPADPPPFTNRGRIAQTAAIVAAAQPDPWVFVYNGPAVGTQPYAPRKLNPSIIAVQVDNPPFDQRVAQTRAAIVAQTQPDPWTYLYNGLSFGAQPYAPSRLSPAIPGQSVDNPPFSEGGPNVLIAELAAIAQPDPWTYLYNGLAFGAQPYAPSRLSPAIPGQSVDQPPFVHPERNVETISIKTAWQPDPWVYDYLGNGAGRQPYGPRQLPPSITDVRVDNPPFSEGGPAVLISEFAAIAQPNPWQYVFQGAAQPYAPSRMSAAILGVRIDNPPFTEGGPNVLISEFAAIAQPDPWTYHYLGSVAGRQPYGPRQLPPTVTDVAVNNPPFASPGRSVTAIEIAGLWQPDPWVYSYLGPSGGTQPYAPRQLNAPGARIDDPPFTHRERTVQAIALAVAVAQPDPWTFNFPGDLQPYGPRQLSPGIPGVSVENPPFTNRGRVASIAAIIATTQPDPWTYFYLGPNGGLQPYAPRMTSAAIPGEDVDEPPYDQRTSAQRAEFVALAQPDPWVYLFQGGRQPFAPRTLAPGVPGQSVDNPPPRARDLQIRAELTALWQPDPWIYSYLGAVSGRQPYGQRQLNPSITAVAVDTFPFAHRGRTTAIIASIVQQAQPPVWPYTFEGAAQPYAPRTLNPGTPGQSVDRPPFDRRRSEQNAVAVALNQPPTWNYTFIGGPQPYGPKPLPDIVEAVPVPPPGSGKRYQPPTDHVPQPAWDKKPNKPFRPVWDKPPESVAEPQPTPPAGPPPLPPMSIFAQQPPAAAAPTLNPTALPSHDHLVPPDMAGLSQRMQETQDLSDAIRVLKMLGLYKEE